MCLYAEQIKDVLCRRENQCKNLKFKKLVGQQNGFAFFAPFMFMQGSCTPPLTHSTKQFKAVPSPYESVKHHLEELHGGSLETLRPRVLCEEKNNV